MCAYYDDKITKIRKEDEAIYQGQSIQILSVKHMKSDKTMDVEYKTVGRTALCPTTINIPYHASIKELKLQKRVEYA